MDILTAIFGTPAKVRILRLFLFNPVTPFFPADIVRRTKCSSASVRKELAVLADSDILKKRLLLKDKIRAISYTLNEGFELLDPLKALLTSTIAADESLLRRFGGVGKIKLFVVSGLFVQNWDARVDILIAGDGLDLARIEVIIKDIEAEVGKEISYSAFETQDFEYRHSIHDRLIRDILDYPHVTLLDRLGVEPR